MNWFKILFILFGGKLAQVWAIRLHRHIREQRAHFAENGGDYVTYQGLHNLWSDKVTFFKNTSFARVDYPDLAGKWHMKGLVLSMAWEGWGTTVLATDDSGETFVKWGFRLENINADPLPDWWASGFHASPATNLTATRDLEEITWTYRDGLPENEGYDLTEFPPLSTLEECREWCGRRNACSGFAASLESGEVTNCIPKQAATGFSPESAVWPKDKIGNGSTWQFHWKGDQPSLHINDDGSSQLLRCPVGMIQHPTHLYQCSNPLDENRALFNKDGTMNLEQFIVESIALTWEGLRQTQDVSDSEPLGSRGIVNASGWLALYGSNEVFNPINRLLYHKLPHLVGVKLVAAGKALGAGVTGLSWAGHSLLWTLKLLHGPLLPVVAGLYLSWTFYSWYSWATAAQNAVQSLINKAACMQTVKYVDGSPILSEDLDSKIVNQCGKPIADVMLEQVSKTIRSMKKMFSSIEQDAWCMHRSTDNLSYNFGAACSAHVIPTLKGTNGRPGPITAIVMITATYALETDRLFVDEASPKIFDFLRRAFLDPDYHDLSFPEMSSAIDSLTDLSAEEKEVSCFGLLVTQLAYEQMFIALADAFELWMRTFAVDDAENFWYDSPCREHYNDMKVADAPVCIRLDSTPAPHSGTECDDLGQL